MSSKRQIELRGVRVHNLKSIDLDIPHGQFVSICGVSGSGKSSLAFDTLYAEGQRRYFESLSTYTRQFLDQLKKPDADRIDAIPPAIAIRGISRRTSAATTRHHATVGTASEINSYLRLMFSKIGRLVCSDCSVPVRRHDSDSVLSQISKLKSGIRFQIAFKLAPREKLEEWEELISRYRELGFRRVVVNKQTHSLDDFPTPGPDQTVYVIVDRLSAGETGTERARESLESAFETGNPVALLEKQDIGNENQGSKIEIDSAAWAVSQFNRELVCGNCERHFPAPEEQIFSFNSPLGACRKCNGRGFVNADEKDSCLECNGKRLNRDGLAFQVGGKNIAELCDMEISRLAEFVANRQFSREEEKIASGMISRIQRQLSYLQKVGLGYLTLGRKASTLSSGESQRVMLTKVLGSSLTSMLYVLDEPTVGLHPTDIAQLVESIGELHQRGNTVVIVDHDEALIQAAERVIEIGPDAGADGGNIVFDGTPIHLRDSESSVTGQFIRKHRGLRGTDARRRKARGTVVLTGAEGNNLKSIDVQFPLDCLCVVTGVSGSGKSTLVQETLYPAICQSKKIEAGLPLPFSNLAGESNFDEVVLVDQSSMGRSSRSNPVTYVKAFDDIRKTFAETIDARTRNFKAGHFSFNVDGGRCGRCRGEGQLTIDMQFMSDIHVCCEQCNGARFRDEILQVKYRARNIDDVLNMTAREAFVFFRGKTKVQARLKALIDVGLDYIRLGQPANTLSTGEAQRLKLALYLNASQKKRALFLLDEPTFGLHMRDVIRLVDCFNTLLAAGHSLIVVEHNLQLIKFADWIIDLGPGAAEDGGRLIAEGTPESIACVDCPTGRCLSKLLEIEKKILAEQSI